MLKCLSGIFGWLLVVNLMLPAALGQEENREIEIDSRHLRFVATFDNGLAADFARGDRNPVIAETVERKKFLEESSLEGASISSQGKFGGALEFSKKVKPVLCYPARGNFPYSAQPFDASISFWMQCDPEKLPAGFIDPLQITDKKWDDASIFVDFNDQRPADFRLGVFSNASFWNPDQRKFDSLSPEERPMVDAGHVPFSAGKWFHIGLVFEGINSADQPAHCRLYINGKLIGDLVRQQKFTWDLDKTFIMLGIYYVGRMDDFAIFDVALTERQIQSLVQSPRSVASLRTDR